MAHRRGKDRRVRSLAAQRPYRDSGGEGQGLGSPGEDASQELPWGPLGPWINSSSDHVEGEEGGAVTYWLHSQGWPGCSGAEPTLPSEHRVEGVRSEFKTQEQNCSWDASQSRVSQASFPGLGLLTKPSAFPKRVKSPKFSTGWGGGCPICLDL